MKVLSNSICIMITRTNDVMITRTNDVMITWTNDVIRTQFRHKCDWYSLIDLIKDEVIKTVDAKRITSLSYE
jgi:kynureninase